MILDIPSCREETALLSSDITSNISDDATTHRLQPQGPDAFRSRLNYTVYGATAHPTGFAALASEWNDLLARSRFDTLFLTHEWQTTWWHQLGDGDLWIIAFRLPENGRLVGIAPLYRLLHQNGPWAGSNVLHLVGCTEVSDYLDLIIEAGQEEAVYATLCHWLHSADAPSWDVLDLCNLPEASLSYQTLPGIVRGAGHRVEVTQEDVAPFIPLPARYDDYLSERVEKKQRHEIRRKQRRAEREAQVGFYVVGPEHDLRQEVDDFIALQQASRPDKEAFMTPEMQRFFHYTARRMLDAGYLRLTFLTLNGVKAATYFSFEYKGHLLLYNSGYDTSEFAQLSPGWVLLAYLIQHSITEGLKVFDFLQGDEEYKYRFGSQDNKVMRTVIYNH
ncbi:MAG: GNAT family N-acetyltransferase [Chloroflexi bacterium]|nr:MAG: GNAT family N-acetyltransferase [Chloroflexota bacterium]